MPTNYNNPNLDFSTEEAILKEKLLRAAEMQGANKETLLGYGGMVAPWKAGTGLGNSMTQMSGDIRTQRANDEQRQLGQEQQDRLSALRGQITPTAPINLNDPQAMMNEAARLQQLGGQMSQMPKGVQEGQALIDANSSFPTSSMGKAQSNNYNVQSATTANDRKVKAAQVAQGYNLGQKDRDLKNKIMFDQWKLDNPDPTKLSGGSGGSGANTSKSQLGFFEVGDLNESLDNFLATDFDDMTGPISGKVSTVLGSALKGFTDQGDASAKLEGIRSKLKTFGKKVATMGDSGKLGNMAVQEWKFVEQGLADLENPGNKGDFARNLAKLQTHLANYTNIISNNPMAEIPEGMTLDEYTTQLRDKVDQRVDENQEVIDTGLPRSTGRNKKKLTVVRTGTRPDGTKVQEMSDGSIREVK